MGLLLHFTDYLSVLITAHVVFAGGSKMTDSRCDSPLGMESNKISDMDLTASSSYVNSVSPVHARVRVDKGGGAWCPSSVIKAGVKEWLEVNLKADHLITAVETQGRYGKGQGQEFAEAFRIEYWRESLQDWVEYRNATGGNILNGNTNPWHSVKQTLDHPVVASKIRFVPHSHHPRTVCMRVELYGCKWLSGIDSYEMTADTEKSSGFYDGVLRSGWLAKGLGVLTDGVVPSEETLPLEWENEEPFSSQWAIWKKSSNSRKNVSVLFKFRGFREFSLVTLHLASSQGFSIPGAISVTVPGHSAIASVVPKIPSKEEAITSIMIPLNRKIAENLKIEFQIGTQALAIGEVSFVSEPFNGDVSKVLTDRPEPRKVTDSFSTASTATSTMLAVDTTASWSYEKKASGEQSIQIVGDDYRTYIAILAAVLTVGIVLTTVLFIWLVMKCCQSKKTAAGEKGCWDKLCKRRSVQPSSELYGFARMSGESDSDTSSTMYHEPYRVTSVPVKSPSSNAQQDEIETLMRRECGIIMTPRSFQPQPCRSINSPGVGYPFQSLPHPQAVYSPYTTPTKMPEKHYASSSILKVYEPTTCGTTADNNYTLASGRYS